MTKRNLFSVALKVIGVYFIIESILSITGAIVAIFMIQQNIDFFKAEHPNNSYPEYIFFSFLQIFVLALIKAVIGYLMLRYSEKISNKFIKEDKEIQSPDVPEWQKGTMITALKIIGVYFFLLWLPTGILAILGGLKEASELPDIIRLIIIMAISLYMIFWTNHLLGLIYRKKSAAPNPENKLVKLDAVGSISEIKKLLNDNDTGVRITAEEALRKLGVPEKEIEDAKKN